MGFENLFHMGARGGILLMVRPLAEKEKQTSTANLPIGGKKPHPSSA